MELSEQRCHDRLSLHGWSFREEENSLQDPATVKLQMRLRLRPVGLLSLTQTEPAKCQKALLWLPAAYYLHPDSDLQLPTGSTPCTSSLREAARSKFASSRGHRGGSSGGATHERQFEDIQAFSGTDPTMEGNF